MGTTRRMGVCVGNFRDTTFEGGPGVGRCCAVGVLFGECSGLLFGSEVTETVDT